jgi:hypothetical protein
MKITTIEGTVDYISMIMGREMNGFDLLMIGVAFQNGILKGMQEAKEKEEKEKETDI